MIANHVDPLRRIITTRASGRVTFGDLAGYLADLVRDPHFSADFNALVVAMDPDVVPAPAMVGTWAPLVRAWSKRRAGVKWAFVLPTPETRAAAESILNELKLTSVTSRCFLSESAAQAWLAPAAETAAPGNPH